MALTAAWRLPRPRTGQVTVAVLWQRALLPAAVKVSLPKGFGRRRKIAEFTEHGKDSENQLKGLSSSAVRGGSSSSPQLRLDATRCWLDKIVIGHLDAASKTIESFGERKVTQATGSDLKPRFALGSSLRRETMPICLVRAGKAFSSSLSRAHLCTWPGEQASTGRQSGGGRRGLCPPDELLRLRVMDGSSATSGTVLMVELGWMQPYACMHAKMPPG